MSFSTTVRREQRLIDRSLHVRTGCSQERVDGDATQHQTEADEELQQVRAPQRTEDDHTGAFRHGTNLSLGTGASTARANVAEFVLDCLEDDLYVHEMPKIADR